MLLSEVLQKHLKSIGWTITDIVHTAPGICTHKIWLDNECKPRVEYLQRFNLSIQEVVKDIIKCLDEGIIYLIVDTKEVRLLQCA